MAMAGRHPAGMRPRDERAHPVVQHAIDQGYVGTDRPYPVRGFPTWQIANEARKSINNAARHLGVACSSRSADHIIAEPDGTFTVHFRLYAKNQARAYIASQTGGDPSKLAYNPFRRASKRVIGDDGNVL